MQETFICPHCHKPVEITEALTHQIKDEIKANFDKEHQEDIHKLTEKIRLKVAEENKIRVAAKEEESKDLKEIITSLKEQLIESNKEGRELKKQREQFDLDKEKAIFQASQLAKQDAQKNSDETHRLKDLEKEKVINDLRKSLDEARRKAEQGSMQTQGEVLELDLEDSLKLAFPHDEIKPVEKGVNGADIIQVVKSPRGNNCGTILWEFKRTKTWSNSWVEKLKADVRAQRSNIGALVTQAFPANTKTTIDLHNGIWLASYENMLPLAVLLRKNILDVAREKFISQNSTEKSQQLYTYITSHQFRQQVEALAEIFGEMNQQVIKERIAFEKSWKVREGQINRLFLSTANVIGGIEGAGVNLPQIKGLELMEIEADLDDKTNQPNLLDK